MKPREREWRTSPRSRALLVAGCLAGIAIILFCGDLTVRAMTLYGGAAMTVAKPTDLFPRPKKERPARHVIDRGHGTLPPVAVCQEPRCLFEVLAGSNGGDLQPWDVEIAAAAHTRELGHEVHVIRESHTVLRRREVR